MNEIASAPMVPRNDIKENLNWKDNLSVQKLLDVIASIIADEAVLVDDLSRLSRSNHQMLTLVLKFNYYQVKLISVSDGIVTDDDNSKLGIQIRGLVNELYLDDLKKKTMRGLEGQKGSNWLQWRRR